MSQERPDPVGLPFPVRAGRHPLTGRERVALPSLAKVQVGQLEPRPWTPSTPACASTAAGPAGPRAPS
jgi:hypothetical protein